jgi:hypothetical protein
MKLHRDTLVTWAAALVIVAAIPWALLDTAQTGRVYLFSQQFFDELPQRFAGRGRMRFILQPASAVFLGVRGGLADAVAGNPPFLLGLAVDSRRRRELLRSAVAAIRTLLAVGIVLDVVFQFVLYGEVHPGAALLIGPILVCLPYAVSRALTTRVAGRFRAAGGRS